MARTKKPSIDRRDFLRNATAGAAALIAAPHMPAGRPTKKHPMGSLSPMSREAEVEIPSNVGVLTANRTGSDFMLDVIKSLGIEYFFANPGSSFRGLHESVINYGENKNPELITCTHEESSVAMAQGYAKIEGRPAGVFAHGTVGLQHAAMAVYNAYCDRVPVFIVGGNIADGTKRISQIEWTHSVQDAAAILRDFVKWDDSPVTLTQFAESAVRAYKIAMSPPMMPVALVADEELQENPISDNYKPNIPNLLLATPPQGDSGGVSEAARLLVAAENPVLIADRAARTPAGMALIIELAESLQMAVIDQRSRMNFPTRHPLNQTERGHEVVANADVILGLELNDFWGTVHSFADQMQRTSRSITKPGVKLISISAASLFFKSNYQNFQRYPEVDLDIPGDAEATLPSLIESVKIQLGTHRRSALRDRSMKLSAAHQQALQHARDAAAYAWDATPISTARLCTEIWNQIRTEDWSLVSNDVFVSRWPNRLWSFDKHYQFIGSSGGYGLGYGAPAAVGAALANRKHGRVSVSIQSDGDLMYGPGVLWTAAHHRIPLLTIMHNNRAYHQEVMQVQIMACRHSRGIDRAKIGTTMDDPGIDFAKLALSLGLYAEGPISDPIELGPAIRRGLEIVKRGEPALIDVHTQPR